jgi:hypothetical protein
MATQPTAPPAGEAGTELDDGNIGQAITGGADGEQEVADVLPDIEGRRFGPAVEPAAATEAIAQANAALERDKLQIRQLNREATAAKGDKMTKKAADAALKQIAQAEYGRPDGGREPIKRILARYGYANPNK